MWNIQVFEGLYVKDGKTKVRYESISKYEEVSVEKRFIFSPMPSVNGTRTCLNYNTDSHYVLGKKFPMPKAEKHWSMLPGELCGIHP